MTCTVVVTTNWVVNIVIPNIIEVFIESLAERSFCLAYVLYATCFALKAVYHIGTAAAHTVFAGIGSCCCMIHYLACGV